MKVHNILTTTMIAVLAVVFSPVRADDMSVIKGSVFFKGDKSQFKRTKINTGKDPNCKKAKPKGIGTEKVIINKTDPMTLRNVLVSIKDGLGDRVFPAPPTPATLTQEGCKYSPHVLGMVEGQELKILNGDETNHNIHFQPKVNDEHNFTQPKKDLVVGKTVKLTAEAPFKVKCDVHPWMGCHIAVFKHPFFSVTGRAGTYEIKGMPPGKYTIEAWHEKFGSVTAEVEVPTGETKTLDLTFEPK